MKRIVLAKEDCYQSISDFYDYIAKLEGKYSEELQYDVRKICCTKSAADEMLRFYKDQGQNREQIGALWLCFGPKANLEGNEFAVEIEDDLFI